MSKPSEHPCSPCAWFRERVYWGMKRRFPVCTCQERIPDKSYAWTPCNKQGPVCNGWLEGEQTRLAIFDDEKEVKKLDWFK